MAVLILKEIIAEFEGTGEAHAEPLHAGKARKKREPGQPYPCCGSAGGPHKPGCANKRQKVSAGLRESRNPKSWKCGDCGFEFESKSPRIDLVCGKCKGVHIEKV